MTIGDFGKNVSQIHFRVHLVELCGLDEGVDGGGALAACMAA
jgi:hypothetical protein